MSQFTDTDAGMDMRISKSFLNVGNGMADDLALRPA